MVILFDLNGTLLDTEAIAPALKKIFSRQLTVREFFSRTVQYATALSLAGEYSLFADIALAVLRMEANARNISLSAEDIACVAMYLQELPPFGDVSRALGQLRKAGATLAVLTNSGPGAAHKQLTHAGLADAFDHVISVDDVRRFKPAPETYEHAARLLETAPSRILFVTAHAWDQIGAARAGFETAFVRRPWQAPFPASTTPTYVVDDLKQLAAQVAPDQQSAFSRPVMTGTAIGLAAAALGVVALRKLRPESAATEPPSPERGIAAAAGGE